MDERIDLDAAVDTAWVGFRRRLADHVAAMGADDALLVAPTGASTDDGSTPAVRVSALAGGLVQVRDDLGGAEGVFERRAADEVAVRIVRALRQGHAVLHPSFLIAGGLEVDPTVRAAGDPSTDHRSHGEHEEALEGFPVDSDHLACMVDAALTELFPDLEHDADGEIPIVAGSSVLYVEVLGSRPAVRLYAEIVTEPDAPDAPERLEHELALLNELHPLWKFSHGDGRVRMTHEMMATPFHAITLRMLVRRFVTEVDQIASGLVVRIGGRLYLEPEPVEDERDVILAGLLELLHLERVRATTVAGLFDHDRLEIIRQIVRIRRGETSCGGHDEEVVLDALRKALRVVADGEPAARAVPPAQQRRRTVQEPLLDRSVDLGGDEPLDLGWSA